MLTAGLLVAFLLLLSVYLWKTFFPILSGRAPPGPTGKSKPGHVSEIVIRQGECFLHKNNTIFWQGCPSWEISCRCWAIRPKCWPNGANCTGERSGCTWDPVLWWSFTIRTKPRACCRMKIQPAEISSFFLRISSRGEVSAPIRSSFTFQQVNVFMLTLLEYVHT